jgi:hypothetical protein
MPIQQNEFLIRSLRARLRPLDSQPSKIGAAGSRYVPRTFVLDELTLSGFNPTTR